MDSSEATKDIYEKLNNIIDSARKEGVSVKKIALHKPDYELFVNHPIVKKAIRVLRQDSREHTYWDGVKIINGFMQEKQYDRNTNNPESPSEDKGPAEQTDAEKTQGEG